MEANNTCVWEYRLREGLTRLSIPEGGKILSLRPDEGFGAIIYVLVDADGKEQERVFTTCRSGQRRAIDPYAEYVGTVITSKSSEAVHFFEV